MQEKQILRRMQFFFKYEYYYNFQSGKVRVKHNRSIGSPLIAHLHANAWLCPMIKQLVSDEPVEFEK